MDPATLIRGFEGFRERPYWDVNAHRVGYGSDTITLADGRVVKVTPDMAVSREDAERDLSRRISGEFMPLAARAVGAETWQRLSEPQKAALTSIAYNYGRIPESVSRAFSGGPEAVAQAIRGLGSHNDGINAKRREKEAEIFLTGGQSAAQPEAQNALAPQMPQAPQVQAAQLDPQAFTTSRNALALQPIGAERRNILGRL